MPDTPKEKVFNDNDAFEENGFIQKKRKKLSRVYQNILEKKYLNGSENEEKFNSKF